VGSCQCRGIETLFNEKRVRKELSRYRRNGPRKTTRLLIDAMKSEGVQGMTLLDIGAGVGMIQHELLRAGAARAISVEASRASVEAAKEETERRGHADRVRYYYGDFVDLAPEIPEADIVTLDRVICCYDNMDALVRLSADRARQYYGVVFPRDDWWVKFLNPIENLGFWILRVPFRVFIHPTKAVDAALRRKGFLPRFVHRTPLWQVFLYARS
jgi:predicted TPR repeat methyltransferase